MISQQTGITDLCRRFRVERLEVFGSVVRDDFDEASSDVDFIVHFQEDEAEGLFARYWDLAGALERLLHRPVDLLTERMIRNPHFRTRLNAERQIVYDRKSEEAVY